MHYVMHCNYKYAYRRYNVLYLYWCFSFKLVCLIIIIWLIILTHRDLDQVHLPDSHRTYQTNIHPGYLQHPGSRSDSTRMTYRLHWRPITTSKTNKIISINHVESLQSKFLFCIAKILICSTICIEKTLWGWSSFLHENL